MGKHSKRETKIAYHKAGHVIGRTCSRSARHCASCSVLVITLFSPCGRWNFRERQKVIKYNFPERRLRMLIARVSNAGELVG